MKKITPKSRFFVGPSKGFPCKLEPWGGHISSTRASLALPFVPGDSPCFPLQKRFYMKKSDPGTPIYVYMGVPRVRGGAQGAENKKSRISRFFSRVAPRERNLKHNCRGPLSSGTSPGPCLWASSRGSRYPPSYTPEMTGAEMTARTSSHEPPQKGPVISGRPTCGGSCELVRATTSRADSWWLVRATKSRGARLAFAVFSTYHQIFHETFFFKNLVL